MNYRGSAGYGEKFRQLNVRNLGVGDAWDVLSGVEHLVDEGLGRPGARRLHGLEPGRLHLGVPHDLVATASRRSRSAPGISNWATYYYNTDITPFTIQYLGDDPADDPEIYAQDLADDLHQAGEDADADPARRARPPRADRRTRTSCGRGSRTAACRCEMVVYKGFGHGITKPKASRAVMQHNLAWFNHYIWGDPLPDFAAPAIPKKEKAEPKETSAKP